MSFRKQSLQAPQRIFKNMLSPDNLVTNWTKEKLHRQQPEEKRDVDPDVVKYSSCFPLDMGDRKTFCIDHRWYEMECICPLDISLPRKMPDCSIRIPGLNGSYESPVANTKFVMIYGGEYYLFYVHRDFGLEDGLPSLQFGSQHFKEMTPGDVKIVRIRDQHCLVKFTSLESGWPESGCQSPGPGKVIICDDAPNLSPGLSFKGSYNGCLTTLKILKVYPPPEHHSVVHPKLKTISSDENEERNSVGLKDDDVFEVPGDRSRFCEVPDLDTPLACIFRGKWHTFRVCRQLRYIIRGMLVPDHHSVCKRSRLSAFSARFISAGSPFPNRFSSVGSITKVIHLSSHHNNDEIEFRNVDAVHDVRYQASSPVHSRCAEQDEDEGIYTEEAEAEDIDEDTPMPQNLGIPDLNQSAFTGAQPRGTGMDGNAQPLMTQTDSRLIPGDEPRPLASSSRQPFYHMKSKLRRERSSLVVPSSADLKSCAPTTYREAVDFGKEVERMYTVLLGPLPVHAY